MFLDVIICAGFFLPKVLEGSQALSVKANGQTTLWVQVLLQSKNSDPKRPLSISLHRCCLIR